jgi:hypothetical protein
VEAFVIRGLIVFVSIMGMASLGIPAVASAATVPAVARASSCSADYCTPADWNTGKATTPLPEVKPFVEPLNVVISARSDVSLTDIYVALDNWGIVSSGTESDARGVEMPCISPEKANVGKHGFVTQAQAWRLDGCGLGNILSLAGNENHVRIWNQPVAGSKYGAWFISASYETACVNYEGTLEPVLRELKYSAQHRNEVYHCIDGGRGTYHTKHPNGYEDGSKDFASAVVAAARRQGWTVSDRVITRPVPAHDNVGMDGVTFNDKVYLLTVTSKSPDVVSYVSSFGDGSDGPVLGPDGRVWSVARGEIQALNPTTRTVQTYSPGKGSISEFLFNSSPALDNDGDAWAWLYDESGTNWAEKYAKFNLKSGQLTVFPVPPACVKLGGNRGEMYRGTDGQIWMNCGNEAERVALDGKATPVNPAVTGLQLGNFAAGAGGVMWATGNQNGQVSGLVKITPAGAETFYPDTDLGANSVAANGNGGTVVETGVCPGTIDSGCMEYVGASGARSALIQVPDTQGPYPPAVDSRGDTWLWAGGTAGGAAPDGQYYREVALGGAETIHPFKLPSGFAPSQFVPVSGFVPPVLTSNHTLWTEHLEIAGSILGVEIG